MSSRARGFCALPCPIRSVPSCCSAFTIIVVVMVCPLLRRWLSKSRAILAGSALVIVSHLIFMLNPDSFQWCMLTTVLRGIGQAPLSAFIFSMIGDIVEYGQWKNHIRQESYIFSGGSVGAELGMGLAQAAITGVHCHLPVLSRG